MKNADKFKAVFGLYATEVWSMPEGEFLRWLNSESTETEQPEIIYCRDCKWSDWYDFDGYKYCYCIETGVSGRTADDFCSYAERETKPYRGEQE